MPEDIIKLLFGNSSRWSLKKVSNDYGKLLYYNLIHIKMDQFLLKSCLTWIQILAKIWFFKFEFSSIICFSKTFYSFQL